MRASEYFLTPGDVWRGLRGAHFSRRDLTGAVIFIVIGFIGRLFFNLGLEDNLFLGALFASLWWRLDPRYPLIGAIGVLVLIPVLQLLSNVNFLLIGDTSEPLAVIAYYLLVIGVAGQVRELRADKGSAEPEKSAVVEQPPKEPPKPARKRKPVKMAKVRDPETIKKLRANREALRRRDW